MRVYVLDGKDTMIAYCRDKNNWWKTELTLKQKAKELSGEKVSFAKFVPNARDNKKLATMQTTIYLSAW